jgi:hypothetical protein
VEKKKSWKMLLHLLFFGGSRLDYFHGLPAAYEVIRAAGTTVFAGISATVFA